MNGHAGRHAQSYMGVYGGCDIRNLDDKRILEFGDAVCNIMCVKRENIVVTYESWCKETKWHHLSKDDVSLPDKILLEDI